MVVVRGGAWWRGVMVSVCLRIRKTCYSSLVSCYVPPLTPPLGTRSRPRATPLPIRGLAVVVFCSWWWFLLLCVRKECSVCPNNPDNPNNPTKPSYPNNPNPNNPSARVVHLRISRPLRSYSTTIAPTANKASANSPLFYLCDLSRL